MANSSEFVKRVQQLQEWAGELASSEIDGAEIEKLRILNYLNNYGNIPTVADANLLVAIRSWEEMKKEKKNASGFFKFATSHELLSEKQLSVIGKITTSTKLFLSVAEEDFVESSKSKHLAGSCVRPGMPLWNPILKSPTTCLLFTRNKNGEIDNRVFAFLDSGNTALVAGCFYGANQTALARLLLTTPNFPVIVGSQRSKDFVPKELLPVNNVSYECDEGFPVEYYDCPKAFPHGIASKQHHELLLKKIHQQGAKNAPLKSTTVAV